MGVQLVPFVFYQPKEKSSRQKNILKMKMMEQVTEHFINGSRTTIAEFPTLAIRCAHLECAVLGGKFVNASMLSLPIGHSDLELHIFLSKLQTFVLEGRNISGTIWGVDSNCWWTFDNASKVWVRHSMPVIPAFLK